MFAEKKQNYEKLIISLFLRNGKDLYCSRGQPVRNPPATTEVQLQTLEWPQKSPPWIHRDKAWALKEHWQLPLRSWQGKETGGAVDDHIEDSRPGSSPTASVKDETTAAQQPHGEEDPFRTQQKKLIIFRLTSLHEIIQKSHYFVWKHHAHNTPHFENKHD
jgi:hypothetical protein